MGEKTNRCTKCGEVKSALEFYNRSDRKDRRRSHCKNCCKAHDATKSNPVDTSISFKFCIYCKLKLPIYNFYYKKSNKDGLTNYCKDCRAKQDSISRYSPALFKDANPHLTISEEPREGEDGVLVVKCAYNQCRKEFIPTKQQVRSRIEALNGHRNGAECRLYCSEECKDSCPVFGVQPRHTIRNYLIAAGHLNVMKREVSQEFRTLAFQIRGMICERCGAHHYLHVHHIEGVKESPGQQFDIENVRIYCKDCHKEVHKKPGCSYQDYSCAISAKYKSIFDAPTTISSTSMNIPLSSPTAQTQPCNL